MAYTSLSEVKNQLKIGVISNLYYIYGTDILEVERLTKAVIKTAVGDNEDFGLTKLNGRNLDMSELYDIIQLVPMMTEYNCIFINDYNCEKPLENMQGRKAEDINKKLIDTLKSLPPQTVIVFNVTGFEIETKYDWQSGKSVIKDKNKKLADYVAKNGIVCEVNAKSNKELAKEISAKVSANGGSISIQNAGLLAEMCLSDTLMIENEINKLCAYTQGREITTDIINTLVHRQSDMTVYNLANAVASMNRKLAFEAIDEINIDKDNRVIVMSAVAGAFIDLYRASCAKKSGISYDTVAKDFGYGARAFVMKNAFRDCSRMNINRLRKCVCIMSETVATLNSVSGADPKIMLEQAVTKMLMTDNQRRS